MTGPRIVAIGDSITLGVGDGIQQTWGQGGWARHVATATDASSYVNLAANGVRARDLPDQAAAALSHRPQIVLCSVGGNDALRGDFDADEVERCTAQGLGAVRDGGAAAVLLTIDRIGLFELLPRAIAAAMARRASLVNAALIAAAASAGATIVDGAAVFAAEGRRAWHVDRIHPSPAGHRALAAAACAALTPRWPAVCTIPAPPPPPVFAARAWWLARHGAPWAAKRSRDLLPQFLAVVRDDMRAGRAIPAVDTPTAGRP